MSKQIGMFKPKSEWLPPQEFKDIKENSEKEWQEVVEIDEIIRNNKHPKIHQPLYVHSSCTPLKDIDLDEKQDQQDLFNDICDDGMCGVW